MSRVVIVTSVPAGEGDAVRKAVGETGAGSVGDYTFCSYSYAGTGRFLPGKGADPEVGEKGKVNIVPEERIEVVCDRAVARKAVAAIRRVHPYEVPVITIYEVVEEEEL